MERIDASEIECEGHIASLATMDDGEVAIMIEVRNDNHSIGVVNCDECDTLIAALIKLSDWANWRHRPKGI